VKNRLTAFVWDYWFSLFLMSPWIWIVVTERERLLPIRATPMFFLGSSLPAIAVLAMCRSYLSYRLVVVETAGNAADLLCQARRTVDSLHWTVVSNR